jgi:hypothetical protein
MTETFEHPDDDHTDGTGQVPEPEQPGYAEHEPLAHDGAPPLDEPPLDEDPAADAPQLPDDEPAPQQEIWHDDPAADDELRDWLDQSTPALDPPAGFDRHLADELTADAEREGQNVDDLVRDVLNRLRRS